MPLHRISVAMARCFSNPTLPRPTSLRRVIVRRANRQMKRDKRRKRTRARSDNDIESARSLRIDSAISFGFHCRGSSFGQKLPIRIAFPRNRNARNRDTKQNNMLLSILSASYLAPSSRIDESRMDRVDSNREHLRIADTQTHLRMESHR